MRRANWLVGRLLSRHRSFLVAGGPSLLSVSSSACSRVLVSTATATAPKMELEHAAAVATTTTGAVATTSTLPDPGHVDLVWSRTTEGESQIRISLWPISQLKALSIKSGEECVNHYDHDGRKQRSSVDPDNDKIDSAATTIPESVLIYERQMRRAQHAKKVGRVLDPHDLEVLYVDDAIVVVNKPPGVLSVPGIHNHASILDLVYAKYATPLQQQQQQQQQCDADPSTWVVHRLDMDTSGLLVFGRTPTAVAALHAAFRDRKVVKEYVCLVVGHVPECDSTTTIDLPLQRDHEHPPFMRVSTPRSEQAAHDAVRQLQLHGWKKLVARKAKPSQTVMRVVERGTVSVPPMSLSSSSSSSLQLLPYTRLRLVPITGRTHQLRVHCAALGHPVCDRKVQCLFLLFTLVTILGMLDTHSQVNAN